MCQAPHRGLIFRSSHPARAFLSASLGHPPFSSTIYEDDSSFISDLYGPYLLLWTAHYGPSMLPFRIPPLLCTQSWRRSFLVSLRYFPFPDCNSSPERTCAVGRRRFVFDTLKFCFRAPSSDSPMNCFVTLRFSRTPPLFIFLPRCALQKRPTPYRFGRGLFFLLSFGGCFFFFFGGGGRLLVLFCFFSLNAGS